MAPLPSTNTASDDQTFPKTEVGVIIGVVAVFILAMSAFLYFGWHHSCGAIFEAVTFGAFGGRNSAAAPRTHPRPRGGATAPTMSFRSAIPLRAKGHAKGDSAASRESLTRDPPPPYPRARSASTSSASSGRARGTPGSPPPAYLGGRIAPTASLR